MQLSVKTKNKLTSCKVMLLVWLFTLWRLLRKSRSAHQFLGLLVLFKFCSILEVLLDSIFVNSNVFFKRATKLKPKFIFVSATIKFTSHKLDLFVRLFSRNMKKIHRPKYIQVFIVFLKSNDTQTYKCCSFINLFSSVYVVGTTCFD